LTSHQSGIYSLGGTVRARCSRSQKPEAIDLNRSEGGVGDPDRERLREFLHWTDALLKSMDAALRGEDPGNMWKHAGYRQFARKYVQIAAEVSRTVALPSVLDGYDVDKMPGVGLRAFWKARSASSKTRRLLFVTSSGRDSEAPSSQSLRMSDRYKTSSNSFSSAVVFKKAKTTIERLAGSRCPQRRRYLTSS
jgi:hypothetical protein